MSKGKKPPTTVSFVSQKGGVGKSTLARLFAVGAAHRGHRTLLADFDLEQLTCVEWNALRLKNAVEPDIDARAFKSLKKLRKSEEAIDYIVVEALTNIDEGFARLFAAAVETGELPGDADPARLARMARRDDPQPVGPRPGSDRA